MGESRREDARRPLGGGGSQKGPLLSGKEVRELGGWGENKKTTSAVGMGGFSRMNTGKMTPETVWDA